MTVGLFHSFITFFLIYGVKALNFTIPQPVPCESLVAIPWTRADGDPTTWWVQAVSVSTTIRYTVDNSGARSGEIMLAFDAGMWTLQAVVIDGGGADWIFARSSNFEVTNSTGASNTTLPSSTTEERFTSVVTSTSRSSSTQGSFTSPVAVASTTSSEPSFGSISAERMNVGAFVGGFLGGLVAIATLAYLLNLRYRRRARPLKHVARQSSSSLLDGLEPLTPAFTRTRTDSLTTTVDAVEIAPVSPNPSVDTSSVIDSLPRTITQHTIPPPKAKVRLRPHADSIGRWLREAGYYELDDRRQSVLTLDLPPVYQQI